MANLYLNKDHHAQGPSIKAVSQVPSPITNRFKTPPWSKKKKISNKGYPRCVQFFIVFCSVAATKIKNDLQGVQQAASYFLGNILCIVQTLEFQIDGVLGIKDGSGIYNFFF